MINYKFYIFLLISLILLLSCQTATNSTIEGIWKSSSLTTQEFYEFKSNGTYSRAYYQNDLWNQYYGTNGTYTLSSTGNLEMTRENSISDRSYSASISQNTLYLINTGGIGNLTLTKQ